MQSPTKFLYHDYQKKGGKFGSSFFTRTLIIMVYSNANESHCQLRSTVGTHYSVLCGKSTVRICLLAIVRDDVKLIPILIFSEQVANCIERLFFFDIMIEKVLENLIYDATEIVLSQIKNVYFNA